MIAPGARLGRFAVVKRLGCGGQGEVLLACPWDERPLGGAAGVQLVRTVHRMGRLGPARARRWRLAALKLGHTGSSIHDEHAHLAAQGVPHPQLGCLYSRRFSGEGCDLSLVAAPGAQGRYMLALAFVPGTPLDRTLRRRSAPPLAWSLAVVRQVAVGLSELHARGVVHHDVRPANVIVWTERGAPQAVLVDLGAAELLHAPRRHAVYGAAPYLPPERRGRQPAQPAVGVDIFGLGMLTHALLAGRAAPPALAALIAEATEPDPARRAAALPAITTFQERLEALAHSASISSPPSKRSAHVRPSQPAA